MEINLGEIRSKLIKDIPLEVADVDLDIAIIGFGKMGLLHSAILNLFRPNTIKYIVDKSWIIKFGASRLIKGVKFYRNIEKLLNHNIDAVYVTTPPETHYNIIRRLIEAGIKAIFVEKPPTANFSSFMELMDEINGKLCMIGLQKRYALPFRHAKQLLSDKILGDIQEVRCYIKSGDVLKKTDRFTLLGRGVLLDLGIHLLDLLYWFFGELDVELARKKSLYTGVDDAFEALLNTERFSIKLEASWSDASYRLPETMIEVKGDSGILRVTEDFIKVMTNEGISLALYKPHYYQSFPPVLVADPEFTIEDIHFLSCLTMNKKPETDFESCMSVMKLIEELYSCAQNG